MKKTLSIDPETGLLRGVNYISSPNSDDRPDEKAPSLLVIHGISLPPNQFGGHGVEQLFTNALNPKEHPYYEDIHRLRVSAHLFIRRDGDVIQFVPFHKRAWHAGVSSFQGRQKCNDFSIGIELEGADDVPYSSEQYEALSEIVKVLNTAYPSITKNRIVGHSDIAPGRKTDPGEAFDWSRLTWSA